MFFFSLRGVGGRVRTLLLQLRGLQPQEGDQSGLQLQEGGGGAGLSGGNGGWGWGDLPGGLG